VLMIMTMMDGVLVSFRDILPFDGKGVVSTTHQLGLVTSWSVCTVFSILCLVISEATGDSSMVDRLWSLTPCIYAWIFYVLGESSNIKSLIMCLLITMWSARLTYNFARKGGYTSHGEDYRWPYLRKHYVKTSASWFVFNLTFIATYQNILLLWIALPVHIVTTTTSTFELLDIIAALLFVVFLAGETIADNQQFQFQKEKYRRKDTGRKDLMTGDYKRGFLTQGLFRYSRHPNFFCEQAMWVCIYLFTISTTKSWLHVSGLGCLQLIFLFQGSTWLTEKITREKYPEYKKYQEKVSRLIPFLP